uniref:Uncharacterized protein n=1 Tax=Brassica oleracea var. oleracea TaxID=109376 RepID=A0A0D3CGA7_BRAOL
MTSRKRSSKKKTSPQSSSGNPCTNEEIVPKEEFEVDQEEKEAYWDALCDSITSPPEVFYPTRPATQLDHTLPSRTSPAYLKTLGEVYRVPSGVVFRVPVHGESAEDPPEGFYTCYEGFLTRCHVNFLGVLILSYERGMDLSPDDFEGLWLTRKTSIDYSYRIVPKRHYVDNPGAYFKCQGMVRAFFLCSNRWRIRRGELSPLVLWHMELSSWYDGWKFNSYRYSEAESMVPPIEGRIRELWEPIEVSEDMTEAGADAADEGGEVDQPVDSFGVSMSGYLDLDL